MHFFRVKDIRLRPELHILMLLIGVTMLPTQCVGEEEHMKIFCHKCENETECAAMEEPSHVSTTTESAPHPCLKQYCLERKTPDNKVVERDCARNHLDAKCFIQHASGCNTRRFGKEVGVKLHACRSGSNDASIEVPKGEGRTVESNDITCYCDTDYCNMNIPVPMKGGGSVYVDGGVGSVTALDKLSFLAILLVGVMLS